MRRKVKAARTLGALLSAWLLALLLAASGAEARPGGGQSYSGSSGGGSSASGGGGSFSSSSSSSSGSSRPATPFETAVILAIVVVGLTWISVNAVRERRWRTEYEAGARQRAADEDRERRRDDRAELRRRDPEFSDSLFEDFARALYSRAQEARHDPAALARLAPYVSAPIRKQLLQREPVGIPVKTVVIGMMKPSRWRFNEANGWFAIDVEFEANLALADRTQYAHETWIFQRSARARTKPWEGTRSFGCPSCGAPLEKVSEALCASCGQEIRPTRFDWTVERIESHATDDRAPSLAGTVPEQGTGNPPVKDAALEERRASLVADDPAALDGLEARLKLVFSELNAAWAAQDLKPARPYLSSGLYATLAQQVETYISQGLVNEVVGPRITRFELVKIVRDPRQDSLTLRVFGTGCDVTYEKATGKVVGGSRTELRPYSEYWTFIRSAKARGAPRADKACPSCGAPLSVGMEGNCEHCGVLVASGDFDWVLGRIEQDDSYRG